MAIAASYPALRPSLLLDFANAKAVDPRVTFTRSTTGKFYDGVTTAKAEENLLLYSQEFDNAAWTNASITVSANSTVAPDGTTTADTATRASTGELSQSPAVTNGQTYTVSVFAKAGTGNFLQVALGVGGFTANDWANFDLNAGVVGNKGSSATSSIQSIGSGWYRCIMTCTAVATQTSSFAFCPLDADTASRKPTNSVSASNILWGAQLEARSQATAYTPTTTQPITNYIPVLQTAAAGVPRIDHDPVTGECLGLLIEEQRTNLCLQSADFGTTWANTRSSEQVNIIVAPDGTLSGDKLVEDTSASLSHVINQDVTVSASTTYTGSVYFKAAERTWAYINLIHVGTSSYRSWFDLSAGTVGTSDTGNTATITSVGNGWYRATVSRATAVGQTSIRFEFGLATADGNINYTGDGYSGIYIWGAQLEAGAFPTSQITTVATQETRNADAASMTGTNFSSWYNAGEGTVFCACISNSGEAGERALSFSDGTTTNQNWLQISGGGSFVGNVYTSGAYAAQLNNVTSTVDGFVAAMAFETNYFALSLNGGAVNSDLSGNIGSYSILNIGARHDGLSTTLFNGTIKKIAYYPQRLTNANLQALTA